jgi:aspartate racemase
VNGSWRAPYPWICADIGTSMKRLGILATTMEGAALCSRVSCQLGSIELGPHDHPDVTLDCIALARSLPAWERADYQSVRATLSESVQRLAKAGADFSPARTTPHT